MTHPAFMSDAIDDCRSAWIEETQDDYWSDLPSTERSELAGQLWDRKQRLAATPHAPGTPATLQDEIPPHAPDLPWHVFGPRGEK